MILLKRRVLYFVLVIMLLTAATIFFSFNARDPNKKKIAMPLEIHLVQYIHMLTDRHFREENGIEYDAKFLAREKEVLFVLGKNLNHSLVKTVHIIVEDKTMVERYLKSQKLNNLEKIIVYHNGKPCTYRDVFKYISDYLQDKTVMFANEDIYLGQGFEKVDPVMMRDSKIMYVPTRHNSPAFGHCQYKLNQSDCSEEYIGTQSYDSFLFHLKESVNDTVLGEIDFPTNAFGIENRCVWAFKTFMHFCILNPCTVLQTFHIHCSGLHGANRTRVNVDGKSEAGEVTTNLTCHHRHSNTGVRVSSMLPLTKYIWVLILNQMIFVIF